MLPVVIALVAAVLAEVAFERRYPLEVSGGWIWMARSIHLTAFLVLSMLAIALFYSYAK